MNNSEIIANIADKSGIAKSHIKTIIDYLQEEAVETLRNGEVFNLRGFVKLEVGERAERKLRDFKTGEMKSVPACKTVKCKVSKQLKDAVRGN